MALLSLIAHNYVYAQRSSNQLKFKQQPRVVTPRYRHENDGYDDTNYDQVKTYQNNSTLNVSYDQKGDMVIQCKALMNVKADSYLAIFNLTQVGQTAKEADDLIAKRLNAFTEALKTLGITSADLYVDMVYLIPMYEFEVEKKLFSKTYNEVPNGFEMQKNLHVRFKKSEMIDDIVTLAAANEVYDLVTIEYFVKDAQAAYDSLANKATQQIIKTAERYKKLGLKTEGEFMIVSEVKNAVYPENQYTDYESFVSQSLDAAKNKTVTTMRKPKTVAYNKLPYDAFDIVLNPEFLEPVVQYTYTLKVKYILNKDKLEPNNKYFIIDQTGALKEVLIK